VGVKGGVAGESESVACSALLQQLGLIGLDWIGLGWDGAPGGRWEKEESVVFGSK
jgi:hypothetical protein